MKKKMAAGLAIVSILCVSAANSFATPFYYTFSGEVTTSWGLSGLALGDKVSYTFLVDLDIEGYVTYGTEASPLTSPLSGYGYVDFFSGTNILTRPIADDNNIYEKNNGYINPGYFSFEGSPTHYYLSWVGVYGYNIALGCSATGADYVRGIGGLSTNRYVESALTLTSIVPAATVPEPSTLLLLGSGLLGLVGLNRRCRA